MDSVVVNTGGSIRPPTFAESNFQRYKSGGRTFLKYIGQNPFPLEWYYKATNYAELYAMKDQSNGGGIDITDMNEDTITQSDITRALASADRLPESWKSNTLLYVGGAAVGLLVLYFLIK